ncbi:FtsW/RodA/SpoVE family cell cycle protein [Paenibacillus sp. NPDC058071]|uniref:FtsW/RodA/SpoVE family cell cycle protein n=1 Tax=Paenibacillus sp. NPDC058071 TaxID=3346326 RepID=UPI0036D8AF3C
MIVIRHFSKIDKSMIFIVLCLVAIGTVAIYEATAGTILDGIYMNYLKLFAIFCIPMIIIALIDYQILLGGLSYILYALGIGLLVLVKFFGENVNGAVRWLSIGSFQLQPSELAKICTVILIAHILGKREGSELRFIRDLVPVGIIFFIPFFLILEQPDLGSALVFVGILLSMLWMGNIRLLYMLIIVGGVIVSISAVLWLYYANFELLSSLIKPHQLSRIEAFLDPTSDPNKTYHVQNAKIAIGSGGLTGGEGNFIKNGFIPYVYSDSIYVVIGEKHGFIGSAVLLLLFLTLVYRMVNIAYDSRDRAGAYMVTGFIAMIIFQVSVNIGMHIGLLPLTGISLPFISYGGSSLLTNMIAIGIVLSIKVHKDEVVVHETERKSL